MTQPSDRARKAAADFLDTLGFAAGVDAAAKVCEASAKIWRDFASMGLPAMPDPAVCKVFAGKADDLAAAIRALTPAPPADFCADIAQKSADAIKGQDDGR